MIFWWILHPQCQVFSHKVSPSCPTLPKTNSSHLPGCAFPRFSSFHRLQAMEFSGCKRVNSQKKFRFREASSNLRILLPAIPLRFTSENLWIILDNMEPQQTASPNEDRVFVAVFFFARNHEHIGTSPTENFSKGFYINMAPFRIHMLNYINVHLNLTQLVSQNVLLGSWVFKNKILNPQHISKILKKKPSAVYDLVHGFFFLWIMAI